MGTEDRGLAAGISSVYACYFLGYGFFLPFFPLVLQARGFEAAHIGYVLGGATALRILASPVLTGLSDRSGKRRWSIFLYSTLGGVCLAGFLVPPHLLVMTVALALTSIFQAPIVPLCDAYALSAVKQKGLDFGRMRLWGSVAFVAANLLGGWIVQTAQGLLIVIGVMAGKFATGIAAIALPRAASAANTPAEAVAGEPAAGDACSGQGASGQGDTGQGAGLAAVLRQPVFLALLVCLGLIEGSHAAYYGYSSLFFGAAGIADEYVGVLWAVGVVAEIGIFLVIGRITDRVPMLALVLCGAGAAVVRWSLFPAAGSLAALALLQTLHGLTFAVTYVGSVRLVSALVPEQWAATGQGFLASASGLLTAAGMAISGPLYQLNPAYPFWAMAASAALGALGLVLLRPFLKAGALQAGSG